MSRHKRAWEGARCLGCDTEYPTDQARLDCESRHVEEELLAVGVYPEWLQGIGPPES